MNSKQWPITLVVLFGLLVLFGSLGCEQKSSLAQTNVAGGEQVKPIEKLISDPNNRLADVPVPLGAKFKTKSSSSYETGGPRTVSYNYGIWAKQLLVRIFYIDNMPVHGWEQLNSITTQGLDSLTFKKADEFCNVIIGPRNWYFQTLIRIEIQPVSDFRSTTRQGKNK